MDATPAPAKKLHPLIATAAVAVTVAGVLGAIAFVSNPSSGLVAADAPGATAPQASGTTSGAAGKPARTASASPNPAAPRTPPGAVAAAPPTVCASCGMVAGVRAVKTAGQGTGVGAVAGGVVGGLVGHEFGRGHGKDAMSVLGVVGGALAGNEVEKQARSTTHYEVDVRLDNGALRTVRIPADPGPIVGTRVRIDNGQLVAETPSS